MEIGRRAFCAFLGLTALAPAVFAAEPRTVAFRARSGTRPLVAGLLTAVDVEAHEREIEALRHRHGYARPLRYMSTDRNKLAFAAAAIDHFAASDDLRFAALVGVRAADATVFRRLAATHETDGLWDGARDGTMRSNLA